MGHPPTNRTFMSKMKVWRSSEGIIFSDIGNNKWMEIHPGGSTYMFDFKKINKWGVLLYREEWGHHQIWVWIGETGLNVNDKIGLYKGKWDVQSPVTFKVLKDSNEYTTTFLEKIGKPICLKSYNGKNMQNEFIHRNARCNNVNTKGWEQMILIKTEDDKFIIQSRWNNRNLQVQKSGNVIFANHNQDLWEKFDVEVDEDGKVYFISCHTGNVMQCNNEGFASCENQNRDYMEAWTVSKPETEEMMTSEELRVKSLASAGFVSPFVAGLVINACVPVAMSSFGTVVAGVGTMHEPLVAGGFAALLQASSGILLAPSAVIFFSIPLALLGAIVASTTYHPHLQKNSNHSKYN